MNKIESAFAPLNPFADSSVIVEPIGNPTFDLSSRFQKYVADALHNLAFDSNFPYPTGAGNITTGDLQVNSLNAAATVDANANSTLSGTIGNVSNINVNALIKNPKFKPGFIQKVQAIADSLSINWIHLIIIMSFEDGGTFSPSYDPNGAVGLIQFTNAGISTLKRVGISTTKAQLKAMSQVDQLTYVEAYLRANRVKNANFSDLYMSILYPSAMYKPENHVLFSKGTRYYSANSGLDRDRDGHITKAEAAYKAWSVGLANLGKYK